jgi:hypothetical protein
MVSVAGDDPWRRQEGGVGERETFTSQEWRTLQLAPFWTFSAVVGAYRRFDELEYDAFSRSLDAGRAAPGRLTGEVLASVAAERVQLLREYALDRRTILNGLCDVASILTKVSPEEADLFKDALVSGIGERVAMARGRFGRVVSEEDTKTLIFVAQFLDHEPVRAGWSTTS